MENSIKLMKRFSAMKLLLTSFIVLMIFQLTGCIASLPVVVNFIEKGSQYTATLDVSKEAGEIYHIVVRELQKIPDVSIIKKDESSFSVEASRAEKITRITAAPSGAGKSRVTVQADAGKSWEESKELAHRVVRKICEEVQMRCTVVVE